VEEPAIKPDLEFHVVELPGREREPTKKKKTGKGHATAAE